MIIFFFSLTLLHTETLQPANRVLLMLIWTLTKVIFYVFYTLISIVLRLFQRQGDGGILVGMFPLKMKRLFNILTADTVSDHKRKNQ